MALTESIQSARVSPRNKFILTAQTCQRLILRPGAYYKPTCSAESRINEQIEVTRWVPAALDTLRGIALYSRGWARN